MKRILKEPLLHFLVLGVAIFVVYSLVSKSSSSTPGKIVVTQGQLDSMLDAFMRARQRPPTPEEWEGLIRDRVREEVYYREALALGMDKDDLIIRRRLRQKMEFVSDDVAARNQPTDAELSAYLKGHPDLFRVEQKSTFRQVYLNPKKHGKKLVRYAAELLAKLNQTGGKGDISALGDAIMLGNQFDGLSTTDIGRLFGDKFAATLNGFPLGRWQGPVESAYGGHLVFVSERVGGRVPALAEVHDAVRREWDEAQRIATNEKFYAELLKHYSVTIEKPEPAEAKKVAAVR